MRLIYLPSALPDLAWMRSYYERVFPEGAAGARAAIRRAEELVLANPHIGRRTHRPDVRRMRLARTPFSFVYRPKPGRIEVLRVIDTRSLDGMVED